jgi:hypothetical protein
MGDQNDMVWSVTTHEHRERSTDWYWALGLVAVAGAVASVFFGNTLLAIILLLGLGSIGFLAVRGPREHQVKIDHRGVTIDGTRHPFTSIHSFWVETDREPPHLFMTLGGVLTPHLSLALDDLSQARSVREHLLKHVTEEEQGPHVGEYLAEIFGL